MHRRLTLSELICTAGLCAWSIGEYHRHVETQSIRLFRDPTGLTIEERLVTANKEIRQLRMTTTKEALSPKHEIQTRNLLAALLLQSDLTKFEIPEIARLLHPHSSLPLQAVIDQRHNMMRAIPTIAPADGWLASGFGERIDPITKLKSDHKGLDISNNEGTVVVAPSDGYIRYTGKYGKFGNYIAIVHGYGVVTKYAHLKEIHVKPGQPVKRGQVIAQMGNTGRSTGTHLHYEVWINDKPFNPYTFLPKVLKQNAIPTDFHAVPDNLPSRQVVEFASK